MYSQFNFRLKQQGNKFKGNILHFHIRFTSTFTHSFTSIFNTTILARKMNNLISQLSDENCDSKKCNLRYGFSKSFAINSSRRRNGIAHFGYNYLRCLFDSPNGKKILEKCDERTKECYQDLLSGEKRTMITSPPQYEYSSKLTNFSVFEGEIEKIVDEKLYKDEDELEDIKQFRKVYLPQAGERDIYSPLLGSFFHHPGIFINGFEPNRYMKEFTSAAEDMRNEKLSRKAKYQVEDWMTVIRKQFPESGSKYINTVPGDKIHNALEVILREKKGTQNAINEARKRFKSGKNYTEEDVERFLHRSLASGTFFDRLLDTYQLNEL